MADISGINVVKSYEQQQPATNKSESNKLERLSGTPQETPAANKPQGKDRVDISEESKDIQTAKKAVEALKTKEVSQPEREEQIEQKKLRESIYYW